MAGDWIKMRMDLQTHPKIVRLMSALEADKFRIIGALHSVWCLFDSHSEDGWLEGYTPAAMDSMIGWPGFVAGMSAIRWIEIKDDGLMMPGFSEHNGASAKKRAMDAERKRLARIEEEIRKEAGRLSALEADKSETREEKRRDKEKEDASASDPVKDIFDIGVRILTEAGSEPKEARTLTGKIRQQLGDSEALALLVRCKKEVPTDPKTWLLACVAGHNGNRRPSHHDANGKARVVV